MLKNLAGIKNDLKAYGPGGFYDAVATKSDTIADLYLSLDQPMTMAAVMNDLKKDGLKDYFVDQDFETAIRPLVRAQIFGSSLG